MMINYYPKLRIQKNFFLFQTFKQAFKAKSSWGPRNIATKREWELFKMDAKAEREKRTTSKLKHFGLSLTGGYRKFD